MKLCIILHCILLSGYSPAASFNIQLQGNYSACPTTLFLCFSYISFHVFLGGPFFSSVVSYLIRDVSTPWRGEDPVEAACSGGLRPGGTVPRRWATLRCASPWCGGLSRHIPWPAPSPPQPLLRSSWQQAQPLGCGLLHSHAVHVNQSDHHLPVAKQDSCTI